MVWFSEIKELEKQYYEWIKENGIADQPNSVIAFLEINGLLKSEKVHEKAGIIKPQKTNFDKITESAESLAEFLVENDKELTYFDDYYYWDYINDQPCYDREEAKQSIIEWLQKECD